MWQTEKDGTREHGEDDGPALESRVFVFPPLRQPSRFPASQLTI